MGASTRVEVPRAGTNRWARSAAWGNGDFPRVLIASRATYPRDPARRALNVVVAVTALVLLAPVILLIAILIKATSRGPVFFTQMRVGLDRRNGHPPSHHWRRKVDYGGRLFKIYKFRTMYVSDGPSPEIWARPDDPRITPIGKFLRAYRLDELPQLLNVIKGDMNIVGPRPEQPRIFMDLRQKVQHYPNRQRVLPGITGLAQINQHYDRCLEDVRRKVYLDLKYMRRMSWKEDLSIMVRTLPVVVFKKGAW